MCYLISALQKVLAESLRLELVRKILKVKGEHFRVPVVGPIETFAVSVEVKQQAGFRPVLANDGGKPGVSRVKYAAVYTPTLLSIRTGLGSMPRRSSLQTAKSTPVLLSCASCLSTVFPLR